MSFLKPKRKHTRSTSGSLHAADPASSIRGTDLEPTMPPPVSDHRQHRQSSLSKSKARLSSFLSSSSLSSHSGRRASGRPRDISDNSLNKTPTLSASVTPLSTSKPSSLKPNVSSLCDDKSRSTSPGTSSGAMTPSSALSKPLNSLQSVQSPNDEANGLQLHLKDLRSDTDAARHRYKQRSISMYSEWSEGSAGSSDSDLDLFQTPTEGLSEVEEGDEVPEANGNLSEPALKQKAPISPLDDGHVNSIALPATTIHRSQPTASASAIPRVHASKAGPSHVIDQASVLQADLRLCSQILTLFLTSQMKEAEELCYREDPERQHMYLLSAGSIMNGLKGMMTFDPADLAAALEICKGTAVLSHSLRKPAGSLASRLSGLVKSSHVSAIKSMTKLEKHAELVYAETSLMKAVLAIVSGGDWMGLVKEALNMRTAHSIYKSLDSFLQQADADAYDASIDNDFRSGVVLGTGMSALMLSLLPGKVLRVAELFGFAGDRKGALRALMSAGGWIEEEELPQVSAKEEGVRRPVCDLILLTYHLVISVLVPVGDVNIPMARKILKYNLERYPNGVFFLYFKSRLHTTQCEPEMANATLQTALDLKLEYVQLQHMCLWDYACNSLMLSDWAKALECFRILKMESNWSKATYMYATAACMGELLNDEYEVALSEEMAQILEEVPSATKKIAGKSLPIEKYVSRKARKYAAQRGYLMMPALELAYIFGSLSHTPPRLLLRRTIPRIENAIQTITNSDPETYRDGSGNYWDDFCLAHFLRGVSYSFATYPKSESTSGRETEQSDEDVSRGAREAEASFARVLANGAHVKLDHWIIYHTHFELGQFYAKHGDSAQARHHFELVMSGKPLEVDRHAAKAQGKYSLESALQLKTHAALQSLGQ